MPTIEEVRQQAQEARDLVEQKKSETRAVEAKLQEAERSLPTTTSQRALRQTFSGIAGLRKRQAIEDIRKQIGQRKQMVSEFRGDLSSYEQEVAGVESQIREYEAEQSAYQQAQQLIDDNMWGWYLVHGEDERVRAYLEAYQQQVDLQQLNQERLEQAIEAYNTGVPLETAFRGMNVDYLLRKGILRFEEPTDTQLQQAKQEFSFMTSPKQNVLPFFEVTKELPRTEKTKSLFPFTSFGVFPLVSAKNLSSQAPSVLHEPNVSFGSDRRDYQGVLSSIWSRASNIFGTPSDIQKGEEDYFKKITGTESYQKGIGVIKASEPSGQATGIIRYPTPTEFSKIQQAQQKGALSELPPIKFLEGRYKWQQKIFTPPPKEADYLQKVQAASFKDLYKQRDIPAIVSKSFGEAGKQIVGAEEIQRTTYFKGTPIGTPLSQPLKSQIGMGVGLIGMGAFFQPAFGLGAAGKTKGKQTIQKQITKTRFEQLEDFVAKVEKDLIMKGNAKEQLKYLKNIKEKYFSTPEKEKEWKLLIEHLEEKRIIHFREYTLINDDTGQIDKITELTIDTPTQMPQAGKVVGATTLEFKEQEKAGITMRVKEPKQETTQISKNILSLDAKQLPREKLSMKQRVSQKSESAWKLLTGLKAIQQQKSIQKVTQKTSQRTAQATALSLSSLLGLRSVQAQKTTPRIRQPQKSIQKVTQKTPIKFWFPELLGKAKKQKSRKEKILQDAFDVFIRRKGKDIPTKRFKTQKEAEKFLFGSLEQGIAASGFILKGGKPIHLSLLREKFRPSKVAPFRVVEKRRYRLDQPGEIWGIQQPIKKPKKTKRSKKKEAKLRWW
ncbi:MAG: hypothetical protein JSW08_00070 [archaeon]|nr:MAG: hypothetical protein JSW08_00070 [archaeon]